MKKVLLAFVILLFCAMICIAVCACDNTEAPKPIYLRDGMSAEDLFDVLRRANSFTLTIGEEDYRFVRGQGYTKFEEGVFDAIVCEGGYVYRMSDRDGVKVTKEPFTHDFYDEVDEIYFSYVERLQNSIEEMPLKSVEVRDSFDGNRAIIKIIRKDNEGTFSVIVCEIKDVNATSLYFIGEFRDFKTLAEIA
ncbi:MAG: hypothetical protein J5713_03690 [Clostridia bacterium]|nr:hypothetical protein [Clostridia bacterium]